MTPLRQRFIREMQLRQFSPRTILPSDVISRVALKQWRLLRQSELVHVIFIGLPFSTSHKCL